MRILKIKNNTRSSGFIFSSKTCFLLVGFWFIGSFFFHQPITEALVSTLSPPVLEIIPKKGPIFTDMHTIRNLFLWQGDKWRRETFFWEFFVTKNDLKFAFKAYCPSLQLVPRVTHLSVIHYMNHCPANILLVQEFTTRGILGSFWFNMNLLEVFFNREMWPQYHKQHYTYFKKFLYIWKKIIISDQNYAQWLKEHCM